MHRHSTRVILSLSALALVVTAGLLTAGPLNPPAGPVASTYKTLTEVEPRIAVSSTNTPAAATALFRISAPGSYYLTGNIAGVAGKHGIEIAASNVTLDLNGFEIVGLGAGSGNFDGVTAAAGSLSGITILNGTSRSWGREGINLSSNGATSCRVEGVTASGNVSVGFGIGSHSVVTGCKALGNSSSGFSIQNDCSVTRCTATGNTFTGIAVADGCAVEDCAAANNGTQGFVGGASSFTTCAATGNTGVGISVASEGTVTSCTANENGQGITGGVGATIIGCAANANSSIGIGINDGGSILNCTTRGNGLDNIRCADGCLVRGNSCFSNTAFPSPTNLHATGGENRIEGNTCTGATGRGFDIDVAGNILIGNTARNNAINWDIAAGNVCLVIQAPTTAAFTGSSGGVSPGTNPWANFTY